MKNYPRGAGTLLKGIWYEMDRGLLQKPEHVLQAYDKSFVIGRSRSVIVGGIKAEKYFVARIRPIAELYKKGRH